MVPKKAGLPNSSSWRRRARAASESICSLVDMVVVGKCWMVRGREPATKEVYCFSLALVQWSEAEWRGGYERWRGWLCCVEGSGASRKSEAALRRSCSAAGDGKVSERCVSQARKRSWRVTANPSGSLQNHRKNKQKQAINQQYLSISIN